MTGQHRSGSATTDQQQLLAQLAVLAGTAGVLSTVPMGAVSQSLLLLVLLLTGTGSAAMCWVVVPPGAAIAGVIGVSIAVVVAVATALAWLRFWYPIPSCLALSAIVAAIGVARLWAMRAKSSGATQ